RSEPAGFVGSLREYQREGLGWLTFLEEFGFGGCLADDMGLGKTVQVLGHLLDIRARAEKKVGASGAEIVVRGGGRRDGEGGLDAAQAASGSIAAMAGTSAPSATIGDGGKDGSGREDDPSRSLTLRGSDVGNGDALGPWLVVAPKSLVFNWMREV